MTAEDPVAPSARAEVAASRLRIDAATAEVLEALGKAGVEALVLKGPSLVGWLYSPEDAVGYLDADLLLRPGDEATAAEVLTRLDFSPEQDESTLPEWWREHGVTWLRSRDGIQLDLHRYLDGVGVDAETAWATLAIPATTIPLAGAQAPALGPPARLVSIVLHAAQHGAEWGRPGAHVERALARFDDSLWRDAARVAAQLDATDAFAAGLRLVPEGAALADRLELPPVGSAQVALRAATPPPVSLGFEQLARAEGMRARAAIVWRKLFPPREFIVHWHPPAAESRAKLALAYARRPFWLLRRAPRGYRAWRGARREVRGR
jgi:putative nucleotidyltransferase-like protein